MCAFVCFLVLICYSVRVFFGFLIFCLFVFLFFGVPFVFCVARVPFVHGFFCFGFAFFSLAVGVGCDLVLGSLCDVCDLCRADSKLLHGCVDKTVHME